MLSLHTKRKRALFAFASVAVILPIASVFFGNIMNSSDTSAVDYPMPAGFEDQNFVNCVTEAYKQPWRQGDDYTVEEIPSTGITNAQLAKIKDVWCNSAWVSSIAGIEKMTNLTRIYVSVNSTTINLTRNTALETLNIAGSFTSLDLSRNTKLKYLTISESLEGVGLESIDLSHNTALEELSLKVGHMSSLDLSHNTALKRLDLRNSINGTVYSGYGSMSQVDVSKNRNLEYLSLYHFPYSLTSLNLANNAKLKELVLWDVEVLPSIDLSYNTALERLIMTRVYGMSSIDLSHNTNLTSLEIYDNTFWGGGFTSIDVSHNAKLTKMDLAGNRLSSINLSNNTELEELIIRNNQLSSIDVSNSPKLNVLNTDDILIYANVPSTVVNGVVKFDLSGLNFVQSVDGTDNIYFNSNTRKLTVNNVAATNGVVPVWERSYPDTYSNRSLWIPTTPFTLTIDKNGGKGGIDSSICYKSKFTGGQCDAPLPSESSAPTRSGYELLGWAGTKDADHATKTGDTITINADKTVYAVWAPKRTLSYDGNDGDLGTISPKYCYPQTTTGSCTVTITAKTPTRDGYVFLGWAGTKDADHATKTESEVTLNANKTFYAIWAPERTLSFDANGGNLGGIQSQTCNPNATTGTCVVTVPGEEPTRSGYKFLGWAGNPGADHATKTESEVTLNANKTFYAIWAPRYELELKKGDEASWENDDPGNRKCYPTTVNGNCEVDLPPRKNSSRDGYYLLGWYKDGESSNILEPNSKYTLTGNGKLYAAWSPIRTITFNMNYNGDGSDQSTTDHPESLQCHPIGKTSGSCSIKLPADPTREGYTFIGWHNKSNATTGKGKAGEDFKVIGDTTLYAIWVEEGTVTNTYSLHFELAGGASADGTNVDLECSTTGNSCEVTIPSDAFARDYYTLTGFTDTEGSTNVQYHEGDDISLSGNKTIYAVWEENPTYHLFFANLEGNGRVDSDISGYECTLNGDSNTCTVQIEDKNFGYTLNGYHLLGFADTDNATTATYKLDGNKSVTLDSNNKYIYAVWAPVYTVSFDKNNEAIADTVAAQSCYPNATSGTCYIDIPNVDLSNESFYHLGWAKTSDATDIEFTVGGAVSLPLDGTETLYGVWQEKVAPTSEPEDPEPDDPTPDDPTPDDPTPDDPTPDDPTPDDPTPDDPTPDDPTPDDPTPDDPTPDDPTPDDPTPDDPTPDDPTSDDPTPDDPTPEGTGAITWRQEQSHSKGNGHNVIFAVDYPIENFVSLTINGSLVPREYYTVTAGSTIIAINSDYIDGLDVGTYTVVANFTGNTDVTTTFTVVSASTPVEDDSEEESDVKVPDTGEISGLRIGGAVATVAIVTFIGLSMAGIMHHIKKRKSEHFVFDK